MSDYRTEIEQRERSAAASLDSRLRAVAPGLADEVKNFVESERSAAEQKIRLLSADRDWQRAETVSRSRELEETKGAHGRVWEALEALRKEHDRKLDTLASTEAQVSVLLAKNLALETAVVEARMAEASANAAREVAYEHVAQHRRDLDAALAENADLKNRLASWALRIAAQEKKAP